MFLGDFIEGSFIEQQETNEVFKVVSPSDSKDLIGEVKVCYGHVDKAVESARKAFSSWSNLSLGERKDYILNFLKFLPLKKKNLLKLLVERRVSLYGKAELKQEL